MAKKKRLHAEPREVDRLRREQRIFKGAGIGQTVRIATSRQRRRCHAAKSYSTTADASIRPGEKIKTTRAIRLQKTGILSPREGTIVGAIENLGRQLILVRFDQGGEEYLFPDEIHTEPSR